MQWNWPPSTGPRASSGARCAWWESRTATCPSSTPPARQPATKSAGCSMWPSPGHLFSCTVRGPVAVTPAVAGGSTVNRHRGWPRWLGYRGPAADASALWMPGVGSPRYAQASGDREPTADLYATRLYLHQTDPRWEGGLKPSTHRVNDDPDPRLPGS